MHLVSMRHTADHKLLAVNYIDCERKLNIHRLIALDRLRTSNERKAKCEKFMSREPENRRPAEFCLVKLDAIS